MSYLETIWWLIAVVASTGLLMVGLVLWFIIFWAVRSLVQSWIRYSNGWLARFLRGAL